MLNYSSNQQVLIIHLRALFHPKSITHDLTRFNLFIKCNINSNRQNIKFAQDYSIESVQNDKKFCQSLNTIFIINSRVYFGL